MLPLQTDPDSDGIADLRLPAPAPLSLRRPSLLTQVAAMVSSTAAGLACGFFLGGLAPLPGLIASAATIVSLGGLAYWLRGVPAFGGAEGSRLRSARGPIEVDFVTGLATEAGLLGRLARCEEVAGAGALLLLRLRGLRPTIAAYGASAGEGLTRRAAARLQEAVPTSGFLARVAPDQFAILLCARSRPGATQAASGLLALFDQPLGEGAGALFADAVGGLAFAEGGGVADLLRDARVALQEAEDGKGGAGALSRFDRGMRREIRRRLNLQHALVVGVESGEFGVHYQPIVHVPTRRVVGIEALARWGRAAPSDFVPLAEQMGLIGRLDRATLATACRDLARWREEIPGCSDLQLSVNLSAVEFQAAGLLRDVLGATEAVGLPPSALRLEITESRLMMDSGAGARTVRSLRDAGLAVDIDDFGTGHSSLAYLADLDVSLVKIDGTFTRRSVEARGGQMFQAILDLAAALGLPTLAEGVEDEQQAGIIEAQGCTLAQGWYFGRPLPAAQLERRLRYRTPA